MSMKQISVFLENKPGTLDEMTVVLAEHNIDMRALSLSEAEGFGIVRIIVDDVYDASNTLKEAGFVNKVTKVLAVSIPDAPGGLHKVLKELRKANININYMYAARGGADADSAYMIFKVGDVKAAEGVLLNAGIRIAEQEDLAED